MTQACFVLSAICAACLFAALAMLAAKGLSAAAVAAAAPWALAAAASGAALQKLLQFRTERFVSGLQQWRSRGGYTGLAA